MDLQKHLQELRQRQKQIEADFHALSGAIQFCEQLIQEQEASENNEDENSKL